MYGLIENIKDIGAYLTGQHKVPCVPYQEDANWEPYLPKYESQSTRFETHGCTVWGSQNQVETLYKRIYGDEPNYSERFNYLLAGVVPGYGLDPHDAYESIRKDGLIDSRYMPMTNTLDEFVDKSDITGSLRAKGQNWLVKHDFRHEWLWVNKPDNWKQILKDALKTSPIGVSVSAWTERNGYYVSEKPNNHWCLLYRIDDEGMWVFDSYDHSRKLLHPEHDIRRAKRIWVNKRTKPAMRSHISVLQTIIKRLMQKPTLLSVCKGYLGTDASPRDIAKDELACAETVTTILRTVYPTTPIITGTWTLFDWLRDAKNGWEETQTPEPECIVISPTGMGNPGTVGHTGFVGENNVIMSNDSRTGKFLENYTIDTWNAYYKKRGFPVYYFRKV